MREESAKKHITHPTAETCDVITKTQTATAHHASTTLALASRGLQHRMLPHLAGRTKREARGTRSPIQARVRNFVLSLTLSSQHSPLKKEEARLHRFVVHCCKRDRQSFATSSSLFCLRPDKHASEERPSQSQNYQPARTRIVLTLIAITCCLHASMQYVRSSVICHILLMTHVHD